MSRGLANCNPGNIRQSKVRYKGEVRPSRDPAFKQFESLAWGYRAIFVLLHTYRVRHGLRSIREMISRWAPPSEKRRVGRHGHRSRRGVGDTRPGDDGSRRGGHLPRGERHGRRPRRNKARLGAVRRLIFTIFTPE